jgi:hypothetical protein
MMATASVVMAAPASSERSSRHGVKNRPRAVGTVAWIIMAPLMFVRLRHGRQVGGVSRR